MGWLRRLRNLFQRERVESEIEAELRAHLDMAVEDGVRAGMSEEEARRAARVRFGNPQVMRERTMGADAALWVEGLWRDLKYALRQMKKSPGFAGTVVLTLGLGIGAATAMFTVVDNVLLRPLPYRDPGRLVFVDETGSAGVNSFGVTYLDFRQWRRENHAFQAMAYYTSHGGRTFLGGPENVQEVRTWMLSPNVLSVLGVEPMLGHGITASTPPNSVILSYRIWHLRYASTPHIIGKTVEVNGRADIVIGVMPRGFEFDYEKTLAQIWVPLKLTAADYTRSRTTPAYGVIARLRPGVTAQAAQAELTASMKVLRPLYDAQARRDRARVSVRRYASTVKSARTDRALLFLFAATGILWLISCVNAMSLLLAHGSARQREISTRGALGASRFRILQQLLIEASMLSAIAALLGVGIAEAATDIFGKTIAARLGLWHPVAVSLPVLGGLAVLTIATALVASIWPAAVAAFAPIEPALRQSGQIGVSRRRYRLRAALVIVQIAMSLVLLVSCGLLLRTLYAMRHVPLGFRTDHIVVAHLVTPMYRYAHKDITHNLYEPLLERVRHLPGVQAAGMMSEVPLGTNARFGLRTDIGSGGEKKQVLAQLKIASPRLEKVFGFRILAGRYFDAEDTPSSQPVVVVNRAFARRYAPDPHNPSTILGVRLISLGKGKPAPVIVGVLDDVHEDSIKTSGTPVMEIPLTQLTPDANFYHLEAWGMDLAIRTQQHLQSFLPELRKVLKQADPALADSKLETMNQIVADTYGDQRLAAHVLEAFGIIALLLCMSGLYGLLAYIVAEQRQEIGVRIALGASKEAVEWMVLRRAVWMIVPGILLGTGLSWISARFVQSFLFHVNALDHWTLVLAGVVLLIGGLAAAWVPARRAAGVDPMRVLRME